MRRERCATIVAMSKAIKPIVVIILVIAVGAGAAVFLSRQSDEPPAADAAAFGLQLEAGTGHSRGPENAAITLVEFGDYQCPSCGAYHPVVKEILNRYPTQVRFEFHHFPLVSIHPNAMAAHKAAEAAGEQGHYWEMHDALFDYQAQWSNKPDPKPIFAAIANQIGINGAILLQSMDNPKFQERILKDVQAGDRAFVQAVPTFFINREPVHPKLGVQDFIDLIEANLKKK